MKTSNFDSPNTGAITAMPQAKMNLTMVNMGQNEDFDQDDTTNISSGNPVVQRFGE